MRYSTSGGNSTRLATSRAISLTSPRCARCGARSANSAGRVANKLILTLKPCASLRWASISVSQVPRKPVPPVIRTDCPRNAERPFPSPATRATSSRTIACLRCIPPLLVAKVHGNFDDEVFLPRHDLAPPQLEKNVARIDLELLGDAEYVLGKAGEDPRDAADHTDRGNRRHHFDQTGLGQVTAVENLVQVDAGLDSQALEYRHQNLELGIPGPGAEATGAAVDDGRARVDRG